MHNINVLYPVRSCLADDHIDEVHPIERLNNSILTYMWALISVQVQTRVGSLDEGISFDA